MFVKFDQYHKRLKERDEALKAFFHYSRKMEKIRIDREFMLKKGYVDQQSDIKDQDALARVSFALCQLS